MNSGPQEQGLPVKQVPGVWSGGGRGLVSETLFFILIIYFCCAGSSWLYMGFL